MFGKLWMLVFLAASIHILYKGGFQYRGSVNDIRFVTPESEPILYYFTIGFDVINILVGLYFGFMTRVKKEKSS